MYSSEVSRITPQHAHYYSRGWRILRKSIFSQICFLCWTFPRHDQDSL